MSKTKGAGDGSEFPTQKDVIKQWQQHTINEF